MKSYDSELQMFREEPREADRRRLNFLRWLAEAGRLEHQVAGPASGPLVAPETRTQLPLPINKTALARRNIVAGD